jgi:hypothetical protein
MIFDYKKFPQSTCINGFSWAGERIPYPETEVRGDTYPITWADDDELYMSSGDPQWGETLDGLDIEKISGDPGGIKIEKVNPMNDYKGFGGSGPKPAGMICIDGILYLSFQNMLGTKAAPWSVVSQHASDAQIVCSADKGNTWKPALASIDKPMFPDCHFGTPAFINFGKNNENARDNYVYAISGDSFDNGTHFRLGRVDKEEIMNTAAWEFVAAWEASGEPVWHHSLEEAIPVVSSYKGISMPDMVYIKEIKRYLLCTWTFRKDFSSEDGSDLIILESPEPWGPFSLVHFEEFWEGKAWNPYSPRIPLKWIKKENGKIKGWMLFSGNWGRESDDSIRMPYRLSLRPFELIL